MEYRQLGKTGLRVSVLGYGASPLGGVFGPIDEQEGVRAVHAALDSGINIIDVSPYYGLTRAETVLGKALKEIPRSRYILATKVGRYGEAAFDFSAGRVKASIDESLQRLGSQYIDIVQCHDIEFASLEQIVHETLPALGELQRSGKVRFIGVTGLPLKVFRTVLEQAELDTVLSYCHYCLYDTSLETLIPYLRSRGVGIMNAAPLAMGLLTERGAPAWHPAPEELKQACRQAAAYCRDRDSDIAQLALQFSVSQPEIATTFVGTANSGEIEKNVRWLETKLDGRLIAEVQALLAPIRNTSWPSGRAENS